MQPLHLATVICLGGLLLRSTIKAKGPPGQRISAGDTKPFSFQTTKPGPGPAAGLLLLVSPKRSNQEKATR
jgi:hypothetical protein